MNSVLDQTELSYAEKEFIHNVFLDKKPLDIDAFYMKRVLKWLVRTLFFTSVCIAGISNITFS